MSIESKEISEETIAEVIRVATIFSQKVSVNTNYSIVAAAILYVLANSNEDNIGADQGQSPIM